MNPVARPIYSLIDPPVGGKRYCLHGSRSYYSERYGKWVYLLDGMLSDGATGAKDLPDSWSWWVHDKLCEDAAWGNGDPCTNWQASMVLKDILDEEGREFRKYTWKWFTFLFGGWKIKRRVGWLVARR